MSIEYNQNLAQEGANFVAPPDVPLKPSPEVLADVADRSKAGLARPEVKPGEFSVVNEAFKEIAIYLDNVSLPKGKTGREMAAIPSVNQVAEFIAKKAGAKLDQAITKKWLADEIRKQMHSSSGPEAVSAFADLVQLKLEHQNN